MTYPIQLVGLAGERALVAGGGNVAARKVEELLDVEMRVEVVAPEIGEAMSALAGRLAKLERREVRDEDVEGAKLVIAATDDRSVNRSLADAARRSGILVNAVDDPEACSFYAQAVLRRGPLAIGIGTAGAAPLLAGRLRRFLDAALPRSLAAIGELLERGRSRGLRGVNKTGALLSALADPKLSRLVDRGDLDAAGEHLDHLAARAEERFDPGTVAIAGAGPGSRGDLTLRALDRIHRADVIIHDALVETEVLAEALPGTRVIDMGRRCGKGGPDQSLTIALMIREARRGLRVVRLHAGDPFVFGRGGEEIDALEAAGVRWEAVNGVSSVLAAPAAAGIPLTRRGESRGFTVRTGHTAEGWSQSASLPPEEDTLVILMGLGAVRRIMEDLIREGRDPNTPAAAVSAASRAEERVVAGTIATLAEKIEAEELPGPATLIVGQVAKRAKDAARFASRVAA